MIDANDDEPLNGLIPGPPDYANIVQVFQTWGPDWPLLEPSNEPEFFPRGKAFTERTGWAAELPHPQQDWDHTSVVPAQNLPLGYQTRGLAMMIAPAYSLTAGLNQILPC